MSIVSDHVERKRIIQYQSLEVAVMNLHDMQYQHVGIKSMLRNFQNSYLADFQKLVPFTLV